MFSRRFIILLLLGLVLLAVVPTVLHAQTAITDETCPALVQKALEEVGNNCDALDRNNACYGFNRVDATFAQDEEDNFFSTPSDRAVLNTLAAIQTAPLDSNLDLWGIATMNVQANVPGSLPGQAVVFMLLGDVEVENAVPPEEAFTPAEPINVTSLVNANLRSGPGTNWNIVGSVTTNTVLPADGLSPDGTWVRVLLNDAPGWISRDLVQPEVQGTLSALPTITGTQRTPMQAFYFRTGITGIECVESPPSVLVVQGPNNVRVDINANGADITIGSTIAITTVDGRMQLFVLSGSATVNGIVVPAGFMIEAPLSEDGQSLAGPWTGSRPMTASELAMFLPLENIPENLLHYPIVLPSLRDIASILAAIQRQGATVVQTGDSTNPDDPESTQEAPVDADGDGVPDEPVNSDEDGLPEEPVDSDGDGIPDEPVDSDGGIIINAGQYNTVGGNCGLSGGTEVSNVASDGSGFNWGRLSFSRIDTNLYTNSGGLLIVALSPDLIRVGGSSPGACVMDWARAG